MTCCCSLHLLYKVHAIELDLQSRLHQVVLFSYYSSTELSKERLFLMSKYCSQHLKVFLRQDVIHFFVVNKAINGCFFRGLVTILTNLPPATYEASRSRRLFLSNLFHSFYWYEYNFTVTVTLYFHENFMVKTENGSWLITEYYALTIRVDQVNFLSEKFWVSAYSRDRLVAE